LYACDVLMAIWKRNALYCVRESEEKLKFCDPAVGGEGDGEGGREGGREEGCLRWRTKSTA
jgi:hypothetical protein